MNPNLAIKRTNRPFSNSRINSASNVSSALIRPSHTNSGNSASYASVTENSPAHDRHLHETGVKFVQNSSAHQRQNFVNRLARIRFRQQIQHNVLEIRRIHSGNVIDRLGQVVNRTR